METGVISFGELRRAFQHPLRHGERRAGRERDADHCALLAVVVELQHALAVGEIVSEFLNDRIGLQAPVLLGNAHRSARDRHAQSEFTRLLDLDVDCVVEAGREEIVMIGGGRAAGEHELGQRHADSDTQRFGRHAVPDALHRDKPGDELLALAGRMGARQRLVEMMMRIDEARQHDMARSVEGRVEGRGRALPRGTHSTISGPLTTTPRSAPSARIASGSLIQRRIGRGTPVFRPGGIEAVMSARCPPR